ncbi:hypothetical protein EN956_25000, partial [Mesorhizobium sp. M7A.F.Ca.CA.004.05.2.1]
MRGSAARIYFGRNQHLSESIISADLVDKDNAARKPNLERDYASLGERLDRRGIAIDAIRDKVEKFAVAIPSWGVGTANFS